MSSIASGSDNVVFTYLGDVAPLKASAAEAVSVVDGVKRKTESSGASGGAFTGVFDNITNSSKGVIRPVTEALEVVGKYTLVIGLAAGAISGLVSAGEALSDYLNRSKKEFAEAAANALQAEQAFDTFKRSLEATDDTKAIDAINKKFDEMANTFSYRTKTMEQEEQRVSKVLEIEAIRRAEIEKYYQDKRSKEAKTEAKELEEFWKAHNDRVSETFRNAASEQEAIQQEYDEKLKVARAALYNADGEQRKKVIEATAKIEEKYFQALQDLYKKEEEQKQKAHADEMRRIEEQTKARLDALDRILKREEEIREQLEAQQFTFNVGDLGITGDGTFSDFTSMLNNGGRQASEE